MTPACGLCGSREADFFCAKDAYKVYTCRACGNGFLVMPERAPDIEAMYRDNYHLKPDGERLDGYDDYFAMQTAFQRTFRDRVGRILRDHKGTPGASLLDIGCGPGFFLEEAKAHFKAVGVEPSREAVAWGRGRGLDIREGLFDPAAFSPGSFDVVTMLDAIEHLPDPVKTVTQVRGLLKPRGLLLVSTGDFASLAAKLTRSRWHLLTPPDHLFYFTRKGLEALLGKLGFEVVRTEYPAGHFNVDYLFERLVKSLRVGMAYRRWHRVRAALRRVVVPMNLWDIMLVTARKAP